MTETILKMLVDPERDALDIDITIYRFITGKYDALLHKKQWVVTMCSGFNKPIPKYTTSLDAAMSIGAEELGGWVIEIEQHTKDGTWLCTMFLYGRKGGFIELSGVCTTMPRAIASARIQVLAYVRKDKADEQ